MQNSFGICQLSIIPLRANPLHSSEMVSQILFGDTFEIIGKEGHWLKIKHTEDAYEGWLDEKQVTPIEHNIIEELKSEPQFLTNEVSTMILKGTLKEPFYLVAGSTLPFYTDGKFWIGREFYQVTSNNVFIPNHEDFEEDVQETAKMFLNAPYLWGGKTHFGIDCSGFSQIVFKMLGIQLNRDASQQAEQGKLVDFLTEAKAGDLAFFDNEEGKITHVGIMLNNSQIIHASGRVKIDRIDNQGIYSTEFQKYSHKLRIVKRYV
jgi:cell wall-associated NlpC family hydrolase